MTTQDVLIYTTVNTGNTVKIKFLSLAAVATVLIGNAQAGSTFSTVAPGDQHATRGEYVDFEVDSGAVYKFDFYFSLQAVTSLSATSVINTEEGMTDNTDWLRLWKYSPASPRSPAISIETRFTANSTAFHHIYKNLSAGNYYYELTGKSTALSTNQVSFQSHIVTAKTPAPALVSAVPEPATVVLLAAGLGTVALVGRRSKG